MKLRYADEAVKEIKQIDPSSAVTARMIRSLIKKQVIPYLLGSDFRGVKGFKVNLTPK